jgi:hypothetical protein
MVGWNAENDSRCGQWNRGDDPTHDVPFFGPTWNLQ